ncbi:MAG: hypothetical protein WCO09_02770, partial [bacterium]
YGWLGMILILIAYALVSFSMVGAHDLWYQILNGVGALGIVLVSFQKKDYQPGFLNIIWTIVAVVAILGIIF